MASVNPTCSICDREFAPQFRYQTEERAEPDGAGGERIGVRYFCSQQCLEASHELGQARCGHCGVCFDVELVSQVLFAGGRRNYACGADCRRAILAAAHGGALAEAEDEAELPAVLNPRHSTIHPPPPAASQAHDGEPATIPAPPPLPALEDTRDTEAPPPMTQDVSRDVGSSGPVPVSWRRIEAALTGGPQVLAVFNHKGGTGKTTTAVTLAAGLAERGHRVLLVDTDGQGNVAVSLGLAPERTLYHVLVMGMPLEDAVVTARPGLDVLASNEAMAAAELYLAGRNNRDRVLSSRLELARKAYDFVVVDCSPSLSLMNQNALVFADAVLCPVACDYLSLVGVRQVLRTVKSVNRLLGHPVRFWGVLPTMFDSRARICHEALDTLREHFGDRCFDPVRLAIKVKEAPSQGHTLLEYAPGSTAANDYLTVVERLERDSRAAAEPARAGGMR